MVKTCVEDDGLVGIGAKVYLLLMKPHVGGEERFGLSCLADTIYGISVTFVVIVEQFAIAAFDVDLHPSLSAGDGDEIGSNEITGRDGTAVAAPDDTAAAESDISQ